MSLPSEARPSTAAMPLHLTKIAFGAQVLRRYRKLVRRPAAARSVNTRYRPTRWEECIGGSLYWIHEHNRSRAHHHRLQPADNGRWCIDLEPRLIPVQPKPKRAHQGWRYLKATRRAISRRARISAT